MFTTRTMQKLPKFSWISILDFWYWANFAASKWDSIQVIVCVFLRSPQNNLRPLLSTKTICKPFSTVQHSHISKFPGHAWTNTTLLDLFSRLAYDFDRLSVNSFQPPLMTVSAKRLVLLATFVFLVLLDKADLVTTVLSTISQFTLLSESPAVRNAFNGEKNRFGFCKRWPLVMRWRSTDLLLLYEGVYRKC